MKNKLIWLVLLFLLNTMLYSQNLIEITINGESYTREYPQTIEESHELIDSLVRINNSLDSAFLEYQKVNTTEKEALSTKLNLLEQSNNSLMNEIEEVHKKNEEAQVLFDKYSKQNKNNLLLATTIGPSFNFLDNKLGLEMSIGAIHRVSIFNLFDFYVGLNINTNIYYLEAGNKISNVGIGTILGIFLK